jgi:electron transport complex protein RnfG
MRKDFIMPILVLSLICLFVTGALALGHNLTQPIIAAAAAERARLTMREVIPHAEGFEPLELGGLPRAVYAAYGTTNNAGYIFIVTPIGYGGYIRMICGINPDGRVIRTAILSHGETPGFGEPVFAESHISRYWGQNRNGIEGISAITGSTITSGAFKNGIRYAFTAFEIVRAR